MERFSNNENSNNNTRKKRGSKKRVTFRNNLKKLHNVPMESINVLRRKSHAPLKGFNNLRNLSNNDKAIVLNAFRSKHLTRQQLIHRMQLYIEYLNELKDAGENKGHLTNQEMRWLDNFL
jgi:hypothetical protein